MYDESDMSWYGALTIGSVLCATDPVAVVALLKNLGASMRFNTLIEGESLLNDGTAMVFFQLFSNLTKGKDTSLIGTLFIFVRVSIGGPALGVLFGILGCSWLRRIVRDDILTTTVTFITCYLLFYFAEFTFLQVSGILSIVVLGLFFSANGKVKIYPESEHALHVVWSFCQYVCETLIFLLTGILIGVQIISQSTIEQSDWIKLIVFYVLMNVMRLVMIMTFLPILRRSGYGLNKQELVVLAYGGLRGSVGLTLSLMVGIDLELPLRLR